jgi:preprotein translocase subunit SecE
VSESARSGASGADRTRRPKPRPKSGGKVAPRRNVFSRIALFIRQVFGELKKVVRPSRADLLGYASAVLVFVGIVMAFVTLVDLGVGTIVGWVFGG